MWRGYIRWIDADLGTGWPRVNGLSSLVAFLPLILGLSYASMFHPNDKPGFIESLLVIMPSIILFSVWGWRVCVGGKRQFCEIRTARKKD